jgi:nitrile hydratase beta subunit
VNGIQECAGMQCYPLVKPELNEPTFHADWERRVAFMQIQLQIGGGKSNKGKALFNIDELRFAWERIEPALYISSSYYIHWLEGLITVAADKHVFTKADLNARRAELWLNPTAAKPTPMQAWPAPKDDGPIAKPTIAAQFKVGDKVTAKNFNDPLPKHTRLPRHVRGKKGVITAVHGAFYLPDPLATSVGEQKQVESILYRVEFSFREIWGIAAHAKDVYVITLYQQYLDHTTGAP